MNAVSMWHLLSRSIANFGNFYEADYFAYCSSRAVNPKCNLLKLTPQDSAKTALAKMEHLIRHITSSCVKGFGYRWFDAFNRLAFLTDESQVNKNLFYFQIYIQIKFYFLSVFHA